MKGDVYFIGGKLILSKKNYKLLSTIKYVVNAVVEAF